MMTRVLNFQHLYIQRENSYGIFQIENMLRQQPIENWEAGSIHIQPKPAKMICYACEKVHVSLAISQRPIKG